MAIKEPENMDDLYYFTRRTLDNNGRLMAWVYKKECPKCHKAKMGKPVGDEGSVKIRSKEYICPACAYTVSKEEFEPTCNVEVKYTCPFCENTGDATAIYKLKNFEGVKSYTFECGKCKKIIPVTKKMKEGGKKKAKSKTPIVVEE